MSLLKIKKSLDIQKIRLSACGELTGLVIVIDVVRAFTTAAYAFAAGAEKMVLVGEVEEAFRLQRQFPDALLAGEQQGIPIDGFHFGNSPIEMANASLHGKTLIFRTSSGTQGVVKSHRASKILVSSFVVAKATLERIRFLESHSVSFVITGTTRGGFEDLALADYLEAKLLEEGEESVEPYLERVRLSPIGAAFSSGFYPHFPVHDLEAACQADQFPFAMEVSVENGLFVLRPVTREGLAWPFNLQGMK
ncbi:2-phosphosulfolactate phosphatase [Candidatus Protochlamydia phocaeensis]|uniref:2-phosphosulfolactate phosphatase n=1 Tax=Candidatus Protochlamydia phocaeensis TaxID=1414722 RepID=UPI000837B921|nr:2-phosphosulfolactate phosphatase [Candidatus Protochlamydia phocaeensis]